MLGGWLGWTRDISQVGTVPRRKVRTSSWPIWDAGQQGWETCRGVKGFSLLEALQNQGPPRLSILAVKCGNDSIYPQGMLMGTNWSAQPRHSIQSNRVKCVHLSSGPEPHFCFTDDGPVSMKTMSNAVSPPNLKPLLLPKQNFVKGRMCEKLHNSMCKPQLTVQVAV